MYDAPETWNYEAITPGNAMDPANDPYYIDFMTAAGLSRLSTSAKFQEGNLGDYNFAGVYDSSRNGTVASSSMMSGPAETAVAVKQNGGAWFRFLRPLTIAASDLNTTELVHDTTRRDSLGNVMDTLVPAGQLSILLIFNPDEFLTAWARRSGGKPMSSRERSPVTAACARAWSSIPSGTISWRPPCAA